jgi:hypothetical protein
MQSFRRFQCIIIPTVFMMVEGCSGLIVTVGYFKVLGIDFGGDPLFSGLLIDVLMSFSLEYWVRVEEGFAHCRSAQSAYQPGNAHFSDTAPCI